ncbi:VOC family protein [Streptomyces sp. A7024]|uniref:VOC family protein n=1 Tax=Streptomyces coryli TaxID=1128680 RepID=A0A6G4U9K3_9ACTN|nr:VOC family protein [Streptomyces coryli]NGN68909.1 VOC family protein [Streptomyces coryli]
MPKITPCLWFDGQAKEAAEFYTSVFPNSKITDIQYANKAISEVGGTPGDVLVVLFDLDGQSYMGLNGGPQFTFTEAISLSIDVGGQDEVDDMTAKLTAGGGEEGPCGWVKDKFGLSWQVVPQRLNDLTNDPDPERAERATAAMLKMKKIDIQAIEDAADGKA